MTPPGAPTACPEKPLPAGHRPLPLKAKEPNPRKIEQWQPAG